MAQTVVSTFLSIIPIYPHTSLIYLVKSVDLSPEMIGISECDYATGSTWVKNSIPKALRTQNIRLLGPNTINDIVFGP